VSLTDIQGKAVKSIRDQRVAIGKVEFLVDVSGIGAGYYVLTVSAASGETRYSQKVRID